MLTEQVSGVFRNLMAYFLLCLLKEQVTWLMTVVNNGSFFTNNPVVQTGTAKSEDLLYIYGALSVVHI